MTTYLVKTSVLGASPTTITNADWQQAEFGHNENPGQFTFTLPLGDSQATTALLGTDGWEREAELYRDGTKIWAGPIVEIVAEPGLVTCTAEELDTYWGVRFIDSGADRVNLLANPDFETGTLTSWTTNNESGLTATTDTTHRVLGAKSAKLTSTAYDKQNYLSQTVALTATSIGDLVTLAAWFKVVGTGYLGPAYQNRGLWLSHGGGGFDLGIYEIDDETPRDAWQRAEVTVWVPPSATVTLTIRLYSPGGTIYWDALSLTKMESLSSYATDEATIAGRIVDFLQDNLAGFTTGKSDVLVTKSITTTGTVRDRHYQFADHVRGVDALAELSGMGNFDWHTTPARVFTTYPGGRGTDRSATVTLTGNTNCVLKRLHKDGRQAANDVVALGEGDGPDREEGGASDNTALGGVTVQQVFVPRGQVAIDTLDETATTVLAEIKRPRVLEVLVTDTSLTGTLGVGDIVDVNISHGYAVASGDWRIVRLTLNRDDTLDLVLNPV
jgi:hypothetical protein